MDSILHLEYIHYLDDLTLYLLLLTILLELALTVALVVMLISACVQRSAEMGSQEVYFSCRYLFKL